MESIENNLALLIVIFLMLLGAFVIGYLFGNAASQKEKVTVKEKDTKPTLKIQKPQNQVEISDKGRVEIADLNEPGKIRAMKTRERAGKLSDEVKGEVAKKKIDFSNIGEGNPDKRDDFKKILGIGNAVEKKLHAIGIYNYSQLAQMTDQDMRNISKVIEFFPGRIQRDDWKGQATELMKVRKE